MQTKTYFASSVPAALETARRELGADALLLNSKLAQAGSKAFGRLEVTFAYEGGSHIVAAHATGRKSEMEEIRQQISALRMMATPMGAGVPAICHPDELRLCDEGFERGLAHDIAVAAAKRPGPASMLQELESRIPEADFPDIRPGETRTLALVGPPGRGKTTTLIKIAFRRGLARKVPVRIYSAGAQGVGCREQMARYASILGVPFAACESLDSLHLALNGDPWKGLILIDTPGIPVADRAEIAALGRFFSRRPEIEKHLVLRAEARSADMLRVIDCFSPLGVSRVLFTGLDEATGRGAMLSTLIQSGIPAVFAGIGQQIPEDLEEVNTAALARSVWGGNQLAAAAAA